MQTIDEVRSCAIGFGFWIHFQFCFFLARPKFNLCPLRIHCRVWFSIFVPMPYVIAANPCSCNRNRAHAGHWQQIYSMCQSVRHSAFASNTPYPIQNLNESHTWRTGRRTCLTLSISRIHPTAYNVSASCFSMRHSRYFLHTIFQELTSQKN